MDVDKNSHHPIEHSYIFNSLTLEKFADFVLIDINKHAPKMTP